MNQKQRKQEIHELGKILIAEIMEEGNNHSNAVKVFKHLVENNTYPLQTITFSTSSEGDGGLPPEDEPDLPD